MATKKERQIVHMVGFGLAAYGLYSFMRSRKKEQEVLAGFYGKPLDDDTFHGYGAADDANLWSYFPGSPQPNNVIPFPKKDGYLEHIGYTPLGPVLGQGKTRYPGLSHQQVLQIKLHQHRMAQQEAATDGFGAMLYAGDPAMEGFAEYGDACYRLEKKYKNKQKKLRKRRKRRKEKGDGWWFKQRKRAVKRTKKRMNKVKDKAIAKGCEWPTSKQQKRELAEAEAEQTRIEQQMQSEYETAQANIAETSEMIARQAGKQKVNPLFVIGGVGAVAVAIFFLTKKKGASA